MLSRRRFLGFSLAGIATATVGCRPPDFDQIKEPATSLDDDFLNSKAGLSARRQHFLGYPLNLRTPADGFFRWRNELQKVGMGQFSFNNVGNPFSESVIPYSSHDLEKKIIYRFGKLYGFDRNEVWGFLSNGGTDSNMHGMYIGRMVLKGRTGIKPKCYFTKEAHYSIQILADLLDMESVFVQTKQDGSMDADHLQALVGDSAHKAAPALVVATAGTTFKGAIDLLSEINKGLRGHESYIHLDAALFGGYLPHTTGAPSVMQQIKEEVPVKQYDSLAVSCHKFFGFPSPAGLFITTGTVYEEFHKLYSKVHNPEYIGQVPGTITCSRDAVKPAEFYYFSTPEAIEQQREDTKMILKNTIDLMREIRLRLPDLQARRSNRLSNTIFFRKPSVEIVKKYSLATMKLTVKGKKVDYAHAIIMPHVTRSVMDEFLEDLKKDQISNTAGA
jgi:glutamate/tyrosine decarboxylase-like PLP-dependent enzyme